ncbi:uncharacterized protein MYCFIDRAFT_199996 [Pseudocercospora fijiensis CIRAD86]|uniref:F-box domain-containing protein n=1 Tax=Pseudocercospora fijiensis (strain CIRAD86) TaxID=383855 RepID=M3A2Y6_PSEFD|nr:uncharacterized protein MYCFIDRAFT_199996 [Pseudocercospora fijiensis CIRAD86]EME78906.1 hypothetical protein MYCFIDRAFT_199996 [Pseudocercospora fijiensis CIRAD86]
MRSNTKTIFYRSRSAGQVRRTTCRSRHLEHARQKSAKSPLLRLPHELRSAIWELALTPESEKVCEFVKVKPPAVALVCRQMFHEAIPIFFATRTWSFDVAAELCPSKHDPLAFDLFDPSVPMLTFTMLPNFPFTYEDDAFTPYPEPGAMENTLLEHRVGKLPEMNSQERPEESFTRLKLSSLRHSVNDLQASEMQTVFRSGAWTAPAFFQKNEPKQPQDPLAYDPFPFLSEPCSKCTDFPLDKMPWAVWSWIRYAEHLIQLRNIRLNVHLDRHVYGHHKRWDAGVTVIGGPEPKTAKSRCRVDWLAHSHYKKKKKQSLSNLKENLLMKEMQYLLTATVTLIAQRRDFRGFTLAEIEILSSVFLFEKWKCESDSCYHCHGFGDPFWNIDLPPPPPIPVVNADDSDDTPAAGADENHDGPDEQQQTAVASEDEDA